MLIRRHFDRHVPRMRMTPVLSWELRHLHVDEDFILWNVTRMRPLTTCEWHSEECAYRIDTDASNVESLCKLVQPSNNPRGNFIVIGIFRGTRLRDRSVDRAWYFCRDQTERDTRSSGIIDRPRRSHRHKKLAPRAGVSDTIAYRGKLKLR